MDAKTKHSIKDLAIAFLSSVTAFRADTEVVITINCIYSSANGKYVDKPQATDICGP